MKRRTLEQALCRESDMQVCAANALRALQLEIGGFAFTHVVNEYPVHGIVAQRWVRRLKDRGLRPGVADLQVWLRGGRVIHIELKRVPNGLSKAQRELRDELMALGHWWETVRARTQQECADQVVTIVRAAIDAPRAAGRAA